jgi:exodeoxyribonuclease VII large subunit
MTGWAAKAAAQFILVILYYFWYCHVGATDMIKEILTVSALNNRIKDLLEASFEVLWVEGEVSSLRRPASGHTYFTLKDERSQVRSVIFRSPFASRMTFPNRRPAFDLEEGMHVICRSRISVYSPRGEYQLIVESMEPKGIGALQVAFEQLKNRLEQEGLFDAVHKKRIPFLPERIGVITSPTGAVIQDILTITGRRFPSVDILVAPVRVQGSEAPAEIIQAIDRMNACEDIDVMILARGGGSPEDLAPFNEEGVARAIFRSRVPVIAAVGHETDFTIADFVADLRAPTPSAAAELAVPIRQELVANLEGLHHRMFHLYQRVMRRFRERLTLVSERLKDPKRRLVDLRLLVDDRLERTHRALHRMVEDRKHGRIRLENRLDRVCPAIRIRELRPALDRTRENMTGLIGNTLERCNGRLQCLTAMLDSLSPLAVLSRGYGIARRLSDGKIIRQAGDVSTGMDVRVRVSSGSFDTRVIRVYEE